MKVIPLFCRVVVKVYENKNNTEIQAISQHLTRDNLIGKIMEVASETDDSEKNIKMQVKCGDYVIFNKSNALNFKNEKNVSYFILQQSDILAIIKI